MKSTLLKTLLRKRIHDRVRGGHRLSRYLTRNMDSVPIRIDSHPPLYVDLRSLDEHAVQLFIADPLPAIIHESSLTELFNRVIRPMGADSPPRFRRITFYRDARFGVRSLDGRTTLYGSWHVRPLERDREPREVVGV